jgi:hypothetical protein
MLGRDGVLLWHLHARQQMHFAFRPSASVARGHALELGPQVHSVRAIDETSLSYCGSSSDVNKVFDPNIRYALSACIEAGVWLMLTM